MTVPTRIVLKSTTSMSLSDRFSSISPTIQNIRANMAYEQHASATNHRLSQQMANRLGSQTFTENMYQVQYPQPTGYIREENILQNKSLQQRLGKPNIQNRLSATASQPNRLSAAASQPVRGAPTARGRGAFNRFASQATFSRGGRGNTRGFPRGMRRGGTSQRGAPGLGEKSSVTIQDLDSQLDEYMARTKSNLDAELDNYMSEATK